MRREKAGPGSNRRRGPAKIAEVEVDFGTFNAPLVVTDLSQVTGRSDRLSVAINGVTVGNVTLDFVADQPVREGRQVSLTEAGEIVSAVSRTSVLDKALDLLAVRARSSRDLRIRLRRAGARESEIGWAVDRLEAQGFVDDAAYARQVARAKVLTGGVSKRKVVTVLRKRGVPADVASEAIDETLSEVDLDEEGAAMAAAQKRVRALASLEPAKKRQRLYAYLARRGFDSDVVRRVIAAVMR